MKVIQLWVLVIIMYSFQINIAQQKEISSTSNSADRMIEAVINGEWHEAEIIAHSIIQKKHNSPLAIVISDLSRFILHEKIKDGTGLSTYDYPYSDRSAISSIINLCSEKLLKNPSNENLLVLKALLHFKGFAENEKAIEELKKAKSINPINVFILTTLGSIYGGLKRLSEAELLFEEASKINPACAAVNDGLGMIEMNKNNWSKAEELFKKSIKCKDADGMSYFNLGSLYIAKSKISDAEPLLKKAVAICPSFVDARWNLAGLYYKNGETSKSISQMKKIIEIAPASDYARRSRNNLKQMGQ